MGILAVSRAIGCLDISTNEKLAGVSARPEVREVEVTPSDEFLLLASDGIFDVFSSEHVSIGQLRAQHRLRLYSYSF